MSVYLGNNYPNIYLQYAKEIDPKDAAVALYCRLYYVEYTVNKHKETKSEMAKGDSASLSKMLGDIQKAQKALGMKPEEKKARIEKFCVKLCSNFTEENLAKLPKNQAISQITTALDLINLLTIFGKLTSEWIKKRMIS
jgi:hypothetical protein